MKMSYRNMTRLACFIADRYVAEYDREMIGELVLKFGGEAVEDFYEIYGRIYGADVHQILNWIYEMED
tara:strand:- start:412 stop:615 length:204 start_codon:yes stop_codon:yes gene_type:complete